MGKETHPKIVEFLTRNQILLLFKHYPASVLLRWFFRILFFQVLWGLLAFRRRELAAYLRGLFRGLLEAPRAR